MSIGGNKELGSVVPMDEGLFSFRPSNGMSEVSSELNGEWRPLDRDADGSVAVVVHRRYRVQAGDGSLHYFRTEYDPSWIRKRA